jgi:HlyD family secretion protein
VKPRTFLWLLGAIAVASLAWFLSALRNQPPEVRFAKVVRETIVSSVPTNGKVEPIESAVARAARSGPVERILTDRGRHVAAEAPLVEIDATDAHAEWASAEARISQARADLELIGRGGRASDLADIDGSIASAKLELQKAQTEYDAQVRLEAAKAATRFDVSTAKDRVDKVQVQIRSLEQRRAALVTPASDRAAVEARMREAQAAAQLAETRMRLSVVRAPIDGVVYQFDLKRGAYLNAGDPVASIGRLERVRVKVYVDEPDLGRVARGMPVVITWDALPGRQWNGEVDHTPTEIVALGTRQVGEVVCVIENPGDDLLPGTNVFAEIRSQSIEGALTIPKEAVRRELGQAGVFTLDGNKLVWKKVNLGIGNTTRAQVEGLKEGDPVALPFDKPLKTGMQVTAVIP